MVMTNEEEWFQVEDTIIENAANIVSDNEVLQIKQTMDVRVPKSDANEFTLAIRASALRKVYKACKEVKRARFSLAELWLSLSTLFLGGFISAIMSQIKYEFSFLGVLYYSICPLLGAVFFVLYFMARNSNTLTATALANIVEENIPDPDEKEE